MTEARAGAAALSEPPRHGGQPGRPMPVAPVVPTAPTRRRPALFALGVALVATGALATAWLVGQVDDRASVVVVVRPVPYGATVSPADLAVSEVSADPGVATVPSSELSALVGQVAAVPMLPGTLVSRDWLRPAGPPGAGQALVGVAVPTGRMPAGELSAGDPVLVVSTPGQDADPPAAPPPAIRATVVRLAPQDLDGLAVVDVTVAAKDGPLLAAWSATGRIALVLEPQE